MHDATRQHTCSTISTPSLPTQSALLCKTNLSPCNPTAPSPKHIPGCTALPISYIVTSPVPAALVPQLVVVAHAWCAAKPNNTVNMCSPDCETTVTHLSALNVSGTATTLGHKSTHWVLTGQPQGNHSVTSNTMPSCNHKKKPHSATQLHHNTLQSAAVAASCKISMRPQPPILLQFTAARQH